MPRCARSTSMPSGTTFRYNLRSKRVLAATQPKTHPLISSEHQEPAPKYAKSRSSIKSAARRAHLRRKGRLSPVEDTATVDEGITNSDCENDSNKCPLDEPWIGHPELQPFWNEWFLEDYVSQTPSLIASSKGHLIVDTEDVAMAPRTLVNSQRADTAPVMHGLYQYNPNNPWGLEENPDPTPVAHLDATDPRRFFPEFFKPGMDWREGTRKVSEILTNPRFFPTPDDFVEVNLLWFASHFSFNQPEVPQQQACTYQHTTTMN
ncbi:hypothetical protein DL96DRAFT_279024 [Flagelloscypha sp. PMI_526]|nr:hypothetical protein DL96DRAFT_279024 [Flagelloscypha sp. PMI_526]